MTLLAGDQFWTRLVGSYWRELTPRGIVYDITFRDGSLATEVYVDRVSSRIPKRVKESGREGQGPAPKGSIADYWYRGTLVPPELAEEWDRLEWSPPRPTPHVTTLITREGALTGDSQTCVCWASGDHRRYA